MSFEAKRLLPVPEGLAGERADAAISKLLGISRAACAELLEDGCATLNGKLLGKSDRLIADALLEIVLPEPKNPLEVKATEVSELKIVFQDEHIVVIDKPAGVASHPSVGWDGPTVPGALLALGIEISTSGAQERQGIVQRLDVGTSGLMVLAKSERAYSVLKQAFRDRAVHKVYHAVIQGLADPLSGTFDAPIARHPKHEFKFAVLQGGKPSITHYETLEAFRSASLVEVVLETGRTHQIRVHFSAFNHPLVGDTMYGADPTLASKLKLERQWLHAMKLSFLHPISLDEVSFESQYPADLQYALEALRGF
ncbi:MAG: RluA family pseudouridine synthase [Micrococcales bacterium]